MERLAEHEAFLRAIFDAPNDDTPRLVYADFLEENGHAERAELIRVQCRLAAAVRPSGLDTFDELGRRERELLDALHPELDLIHWTPDERARISMDRGFATQPVAVICPGELDDIDAARRKIVQSRPHWFGVRSLAVQPGWFLQPDHLTILLDLLALRGVTEWHLGGHVDEQPAGSQTDDHGTYALIDMNVEPVITNEGVVALARHRGARRIETLILTHNNLDNDAARAIVQSPHLIRLKRLELLEGNRLRGRTWQQLLEKYGENVVG